MDLGREDQKGRFRRVQNIECIKELCRQMILIAFCQKNRKKSRTEKTVTPTTSGYNLRPRNGKGVESRPTIEKKTQHGGPVLSRKGRGRNDSPYIEERTKSSNKNARRGGDQQRQDQEWRKTTSRTW
ncbi:hypothetical protein TNCV_26591 [Trichonephila clavipes]|uniref:Uncharacterized protein n=1 Tax=Trichonephila clavipes TaxID=2585209 RepID=A0A8X6WMK0_TRICX|nr:hypothetical protein TNCV_26591 [Trichonephila clavipes]